MIAISALIERWRAGDERAAQALYDHFWDRTFWLAYGLLGDAGDAEEVAQDAQTGEEIWKLETGAGVKSSPLVADGMVYFGGEDGYLYAVR